MNNQSENNSVESTEQVLVAHKFKNFLARHNISPAKVKTTSVILIFLLLILGGYYWYSLSQRVYSDKAEIYAPLIVLSPAQSSILEKIMVKAGDEVYENQVVAKLEGNQFVRAKTAGIVVNVNDQVGKMFSPGVAVVTMINPDDLRLIVHVAENKGFKLIKVGQTVKFTVDAFDSRKFYGEVEEISPSADQSSVVFSISDKREEKNYSIKVKYHDYPELLNGMSAKAWIYK